MELVTKVGVQGGEPGERLGDPGAERGKRERERERERPWPVMAASLP
jgi:hypothetical protein